MNYRKVMNTSPRIAFDNEMKAHFVPGQGKLTEEELDAVEAFEWDGNDFIHDVIPKEKSQESKFILWNQKVLDLHKTNKKIRLGQNYMIALSEVDLELYKNIAGTSSDCFYDDSKAYSLMEYLTSYWEEK